MNIDRCSGKGNMKKAIILLLLLGGTACEATEPAAKVLPEAPTTSIYTPAPGCTLSVPGLHRLAPGDDRAPFDAALHALAEGKGKIDYRGALWFAGEEIIGYSDAEDGDIFTCPDYDWID